MDILKVFASNAKKHRNIMGLFQEAFSKNRYAIEWEKRSISLDNV